jgi:hypothetical protein
MFKNTANTPPPTIEETEQARTLMIEALEATKDLDKAQAEFFASPVNARYHKTADDLTKFAENVGCGDPRGGWDPYRMLKRYGVMLFTGREQ